MTIPNALRGWWRYSKLTAIPLGTNALVTLFLWLAALRTRHLFNVVTATVMTALLVGQLIYGAINAERSRRYGCW